MRATTGGVTEMITDAELKELLQLLLKGVEEMLLGDFRDALLGRTSQLNLQKYTGEWIRDHLDELVNATKNNIVKRALSEAA
jgi:hypothetical protein